MRRRKSAKDRNLHERGGVFYYTAIRNGKRFKLSLKTTDRAVARKKRDEIEEELRKPTPPPSEVRPTFAEMAERYLAEDVEHLAPTTLTLRRNELSEASRGGVLRHFGRLRIDEIDSSHIHEWWAKEITAKKRDPDTGKNYLAAIAGPLEYARDRKLIREDPVGEFRRSLRRKARTKQGRADKADRRQPIEDPADIAVLLAAAKEQGTWVHALVLCMLDAGLRLGEVRGLRWSRIRWAHPDDPRRALVVDRSIPSHGPPGPPKSGRERKVALSRRL